MFKNFKTYILGSELISSSDVMSHIGRPLAFGLRPPGLPLYVQKITFGVSPWSPEKKKFKILLIANIGYYIWQQLENFSPEEAAVSLDALPVPDDHPGVADEGEVAEEGEAVRGGAVDEDLQVGVDGEVPPHVPGHPERHALAGVALQHQAAVRLLA